MSCSRLPITPSPIVAPGGLCANAGQLIPSATSRQSITETETCRFHKAKPREALPVMAWKNHGQFLGANRNEF